MPYSENIKSGIATEKTDVYSYGVLLIEMISGKRPTELPSRYEYVCSLDFREQVCWLV